jgi:hypothetical protein
MFLLSALCFAQQNANIRVIGRIPDAADSRLYQLQVGAFRFIQNASKAFEKLRAASLYPHYEQYQDIIRVMIKGISAKDVPAYIEKIRKAGFSEVYIKPDTAGVTAVRPPVSAPPPAALAVVPAEKPYPVPESREVTLSKAGKTGGFSIENFPEYKTEPEFRLAYKFTNKGENKGASGGNGGIDIIGMGSDSEWLWTTYYQGGWLYDLNGINCEMVDGYQKDPRNGVELTVRPEFVYNEGIYYLQLMHILSNPGNALVSGQKFGASADVMMHKNDDASILHTSYGAYMADADINPAYELMFFCESGDDGIDPVDTLWLGKWDDGSHLENIYSDDRFGIWNTDSAIAFSYQNIDLEPGQKKEFVVKFALVRKED